MANYQWVNGVLVDTDIGKGLGSMRIDSMQEASTNLTPTEMYFGKNPDSYNFKTAQSSASNNIFGADGFGFNKGTLQGLGTIGDIGAGLGKLFLGAKQLGLAEDKFAFDKDMLNKQYAMAKDAYDKQTARSASIGSQMATGRVG